MQSKEVEGGEVKYSFPDGGDYVFSAQLTDGKTGKSFAMAARDAVAMSTSVEADRRAEGKMELNRLRSANEDAKAASEQAEQQQVAPQTMDPGMDPAAMQAQGPDPMAGQGMDPMAAMGEEKATGGVDPAMLQQMMQQGGAAPMMASGGYLDDEGPIKPFPMRPMDFLRPSTNATDTLPMARIVARAPNTLPTAEVTASRTLPPPNLGTLPAGVNVIPEGGSMFAPAVSGVERMRGMGINLDPVPLDRKIATAIANPRAANELPTAVVKASRLAPATTTPADGTAVANENRFATPGFNLDPVSLSDQIAAKLKPAPVAAPRIKIGLPQKLSIEQQVAERLPGFDLATVPRVPDMSAYGKRVPVARAQAPTTPAQRSAAAAGETDRATPSGSTRPRGTSTSASPAPAAGGATAQAAPTAPQAAEPDYTPAVTPVRSITNDRFDGRIVNPTTPRPTVADRVAGYDATTGRAMASTAPQSAEASLTDALTSMLNGDTEPGTEPKPDSGKYNQVSELLAGMYNLSKGVEGTKAAYNPDSAEARRLIAQVRPVDVTAVRNRNRLETNAALRQSKQSATGAGQRMAANQAGASGVAQATAEQVAGMMQANNQSALGAAGMLQQMGEYERQESVRRTTATERAKAAQDKAREDLAHKFDARQAAILEKENGDREFAATERQRKATNAMGVARLANTPDFGAVFSKEMLAILAKYMQ